MLQPEVIMVVIPCSEVIMLLQPEAIMVVIPAAA